MNRPSIFSRLIHVITFLFRNHPHKISVHGTSAQVEPLADGVEIFHRGWGTEVHGASGQFVWIHFAIPVPLLVDDVRPAVTSVYFHFAAEGNASLRQIHLYDGKTRFHTLETHRDGDFTQALVLDVNKIEVIRSLRTALGISLGFQLTQSISGGSSSNVHVVSAGAEYIT